MIPPSFDCCVIFPLDRANKPPLAMTTGSGTEKLPETQAGSRVRLTPSGAAFTLKAMMLPFGLGPLVNGNFGACFETGPQIGTQIQEPPVSSCHAERAPHTPFA